MSYKNILFSCPCCGPVKVLNLGDWSYTEKDTTQGKTLRCDTCKTIYYEESEKQERVQSQEAKHTFEGL